MMRKAAFALTTAPGKTGCESAPEEQPQQVTVEPEREEVQAMPLTKYRSISELYNAVWSSSDYIRKDLTDLLYHATRLKILMGAFTYYDEDEEPESEMPEVFEPTAQAYKKATELLGKAIHQIYPYANQDQVWVDVEDELV